MSNGGEPTNSPVGLVGGTLKSAAASTLVGNLSLPTMAWSAKDSGVFYAGVFCLSTGRWPAKSSLLKLSVYTICC